MAAITLFSTAAPSPLGSGHHLTNDSKASEESATLPPKCVKGDLRIFHQNVGRLSLSNAYFPVFICCAVWLWQVGE